MSDRHRVTLFDDWAERYDNCAQRFIALGCEVWGADLSSAMLTKARAKVPQVRLVQMDLLWDMWPDDLTGQRFDRIVSTYVFHEFDLATKVRLLKRLVPRHTADLGFWQFVCSRVFLNARGHVDIERYAVAIPRLQLQVENAQVSYVNRH